MGDSNKHSHYTFTKRSVQRVLLLLVLLVPLSLIAVPSLVLARINVQAAIEPEAFPADRQGHFTLTVEGTNSADFNLPEIDGLMIMRRGQSSKSVFSFNGQSSESIVYNFVVQANAPGDYEIPAIIVFADKDSFTTEPIRFSVTAPAVKNQGTAVSGGSTDPIETSQEAFMTLDLPDGAHYTGQVIPVTINAYFPQPIRISEIGYPELTGEGVVLPQLDEDPRKKMVQSGGVTYTVLSWKSELSLIKDGNHDIQLEMEAIQLVEQKRRSTSPFGGNSIFGNDPFFNNFFGNLRKKRLKITSNPIQLNVLSLPREGRPGNFSGSVGEFSLVTDVTPKRAEIGEPLTLNMVIEGTGNIDGVEPPTFPDTQHWKSYNPTQQTAKDGRGKGKKTFEQAIVATSDTVRHIPALSFSYFSPEQRDYVTVKSEPISITITSAQNNPDIPEAKSELTEKTTSPQVQLSLNGEGPPPLHVEMGKPVKQITPLFRQKLYLILCATVTFLLLLGISLHLYQAKVKRRLADSSEIRKKRLSNSFSELERLAASNEGKTFCLTLRQLIQQQLGAVWDCPPDAITCGDITTKLPDSKKLQEIFLFTDQTAYSNIAIGSEDMKRMLRQARNEVEKLR